MIGATGAAGSVALVLSDGATAAVSAANESRLRQNGAALELSSNGGAYAALGGAATTMTDTGVVAENVTAGAPATRFNSAGTSKYELGCADGNNGIGGRQYITGLFLASVLTGATATVITEGVVAVPDAIWDSVPAVADQGKLFYASVNRGMLSKSPPTPSATVYVLPLGTIRIGGAGAVTVLVQPNMAQDDWRFTTAWVSGNTTLGTGASNTITVNGTFNTSLNPLNDNSVNAGTSLKRWANINATSLVARGDLTDTSKSTFTATTWTATGTLAIDGTGAITLGGTNGTSLTLSRSGQTTSIAGHAKIGAAAGNLGFFANAGAAKQTIAGVKVDAVAASILAALVAYNMVTDTTT